MLCHLCEIIYLRMSPKYVLKIMQCTRIDEREMSITEKILNFGFVSLLFSYSYDHGQVVMHCRQFFKFQYEIFSEIDIIFIM
jgi:hypothetical protein